MKLAIAQINSTVGDLAGNAAKILSYAEQAREQGAQLLLAPELALCGYPPEDLLLRDGFNHACAQALGELAGKISGIAVVVGHPHEHGGKRYNAASLLRDGKVEATYHKRLLPNYSVFDEERYFDHGGMPCVFEIEGVRFGVNICADIWEPGTASLAREAGAQVLLVPNASPYALEKQEARYGVIRDRISETGMSVVYANLVGGQDELVFDGGSFAMDGSGTLTAQGSRFDESLMLLEMGQDLRPVGEMAEPMSEEAEVYRALCVGVRDYIVKNRFPGVLLGLSGGIDSALTLAVAVDALGADKVHAVMMPSPYTAQISLDDSREMVKTLGVRYDEFSIEPMFQSYLATLHDAFVGCEADTTEENLQARIRGTLLMALSNKFGSLVLTTGNKSEMTVGYATLYGDMAGGFAVLKDVGKMLVYRLARYRNTLGQVIPERIIIRPPSAELRADQTDQDSLPPYEVLDAIMACYVEQNLSVPEIIARGYDEADVRRVVRLIRISEYKRRQSAVGIRITERSYGKDWRYPITVCYQDGF
ncbi:NAD+ synthase [Ferrigenium kumadai]|uniref:Glutamine-dependent NAD(+) synthetase n=1 Tax=Ferrigenium kumadai TaxID=1682490 RepID=A0AAN1T0I3_9PROT|nr:NAD+ synthase [Ferrigenium kumadai]BBI99615.1 NAD+ synthase [Ferrigenium kumadai]